MAVPPYSHFRAARCAAPTKFKESFRFCCRGRRSRRPAGALCAPLQREKEARRDVLWEGESPRRFAAPPFDKGGFGGSGTSGEPLGLPFRRAPSSGPSGHLPPRRGKAYGGRKGRPYDRKRTGSVGSVKPGAAVELYQPSILGQPGPSGPVGI